MNIINIPIAKIKPYKKNPRKNDHAVDAVAASIKEFGFLVPMVIDRNHEIVAGHTRYKAAKSLGMKEVPCVIAEELTPTQIKAFRLADNKVSELAGWDFGLLDELLSELGDFDMQKFGFLPKLDIDIDGAFAEAADTEDTADMQESENMPRRQIITCPHCGKTFEL